MSEKVVDEVEMYQMDLGNLLPGQFAVVEVQMMQQLRVHGGNFQFCLPWAYFPEVDGEGADLLES